MLEGAMPGDGAAVSAMAVGAASALVGLVLMLRGARARVAFLVFAAGVVLVALPQVPRRVPSEAKPADTPVAVGGGVVISTEAGVTVARPVPAPVPPLPGRPAAVVSIEATEAEPNDSVAAANVAPLGVSIAGVMAPGDADFFRVTIPGTARGALVASVIVMDGDVTLLLLDDAGQTLGLMTTRAELRVRSVTLERKLERPVYAVAVMPESEGPVAYRLTIAARPR